MRRGEKENKRDRKKRREREREGGKDEDAARKGVESRDER